MMKTKILNNTEVRQKLRRMSYQILENNLNEKEIIIAGIAGNGYEIAKRLEQELTKVSQFDITRIEIILDKEAPTQGDIELRNTDTINLHKKVIILVDDVLNTGRTIAYSLKPFLSERVKKIQTAVLVNRSHTEFPIAPTYTGYELSTTLSDHIEVSLSPGKEVVYLV